MVPIDYSWYCGVWLQDTLYIFSLTVLKGFTSASGEAESKDLSELDLARMFATPHAFLLLWWAIIIDQYSCIQILFWNLLRNLSRQVALRRTIGYLIFLILCKFQFKLREQTNGNFPLRFKPFPGQMQFKLEDLKCVKEVISVNYFLFKLDFVVTFQGDRNIANFSQISNLSRTLKFFLRWPRLLLQSWELHLESWLR